MWVLKNGCVSIFNTKGGMMNIILAIDGSVESFSAVEFLIRLPLISAPNIRVLTVLEDDAFSELPTVRPEVNEREASEHFARASSLLATVGYQAIHISKRGHPSRAILDAAHETDADLIVLGAIGHSAILRILLGSTADYVANHATCSVLVVRPDSVGAADSTQFRVMLAYDGSQFAKFASRQMFSFPWSAERDRIHIAMMLGRPKLAPEEDEAYDPEGVEDAEKALPMLRGSDSTSCEVSYTVRETLHIGYALLDIATQKNINLLFVGPAGKSALSRFFLGSTSRYLLHHANCSVWIARKKTRDDH
jgi:nucleotide-binding universal stress UspA family protein